MKQVVIEMSGGVVQEVYADTDVRVVIIDWDDYESSNDSCAGEIRTTRLDAMPPDTECQFSRVT